MSYPTLETMNMSGGTPTVLTAAATISPILFPLILTAVFIIFLMCTYFAQIRLRNQGDFPASFTIAGLGTTLIAFFMSLIPGLIPTTVIVICIAVTIAGVLWLFFDDS